MEQNNSITQPEKISLGQTPENPVVSVVSEEKSPVPVVERPKTRLFIIVGLTVVLALTIATILIILKYAPEPKAVEIPVAEPAVTKPQSVPPTAPDEQIVELNKQGTSTEISDIQKDLDNTLIDNIDKDLEGLENLLQ